MTKPFKVNDKCNEDRICMEIIDSKGRRYRFTDIVDYLNSLHEENQHIKQTIKEAYNNERTQIGKNVLKQLLEALK